jgi:hypothetical protein
MNVKKLNLKIQLPILGFGLVKDFWKWNFLSLKNDIFTKDFQKTYIINICRWSKKWDVNNLLDTLKIIHNF